jgi:hypothetical protein
LLNNNIVILNTIVNCFTVRLGLGGLADNQIDTSCLHSMHRTPPEARSHDISQTASTVRTPEHGRDAAPYCSLPIDEHYSFQIVFDQNGHQWPSLVIDGHRWLSKRSSIVVQNGTLHGRDSQFD